MTRKEAYQIYYLNKEIEMWQRELLSLQEASIQSTRITGMPRSGKAGASTIEQDVIRLEEVESVISSLLVEVQMKRKEIYNYIATLDNSLLRQIIMYRCLSLCTWQETANYVGGGNTAESVRKMFNRHFRKQEENK